MNVLITGAFGLIGSSLLETLENEDFNVRCFDVKTRKTRKRAKKFRNKFEIIWGDIRNKEDVTKAVADQDFIIHLAFFLPPINDENRRDATEVNITGTKNIIESARNLTKPPKLIFASSVAIYGDTREKHQPINTNEKPNPTDNYSKHKVECMNLIKQSNLTYSIYILGVITPVKELMYDAKMFDVPIDTNIELLHPFDVGAAFANGLTNEKIWNKTLHIAGGPSCRLNYRNFVNSTMKAMGIGSIPDEAFGGSIYHSSFLSSEESNKMLNYQHHSYDDIISDMRKYNELVISIAKLLKPIIRRFILNQSPYYKKNLRKQEDKE
ncbi:MAG: NAD-dependent epimerase/dehydratase family protein [Candidatus Heimdallarchaeota archaeon]